MKEKKQKKKHTFWRVLGDIIFFSVVGFIAAYFVWNQFDIHTGYQHSFFGTRNSVIVSPSMSTVNESNDYITEDMKQLQKYDVITTLDYKSFDEIEIYDIATYCSSSNELICHRVVDKYEADGKQYIVFRGDANNINDEPVSYELIRGKVVYVTPKIGHVVAFVQSPYILIAIFGTLFFVFFGAFIITYKKEKKADRESAQAPAEQAEQLSESHNENQEPQAEQ